VRNIFKRRSPARQVVQLSREDIAELLILRWHGYTPEKWDALPSLVKLEKRDHYYRAKGMAS